MNSYWGAPYLTPEAVQNPAAWTSACIVTTFHCFGLSLETENVRNEWCVWLSPLNHGLMSWLPFIVQPDITKSALSISCTIYQCIVLKDSINFTGHSGLYLKWILTFFQVYYLWNTAVHYQWFILIFFFFFLEFRCPHKVSSPPRKYISSLMTCSLWKRLKSFHGFSDSVSDYRISFEFTYFYEAKISLRKM